MDKLSLSTINKIIGWQDTWQSPVKKKELCDNSLFNSDSILYFLVKNVFLERKQIGSDKILKTLLKFF